MQTCPNCDGIRQVFVFADGHRADGTPFAENGYRHCMMCKGAGEITADHAERIKIGKLMRDERVARGVGLLEASKALGCSPAELSGVERGDLPKSSPET